jgi:hypothetical protein
MARPNPLWVSVRLSAALPSSPNYNDLPVGGRYFQVRHPRLDILSNFSIFRESSFSIFKLRSLPSPRGTLNRGIDLLVKVQVRYFRAIPITAIQ